MDENGKIVSRVFRKARWICPGDYDGSGNYYFLARKVFCWSRSDCALLRISADSHYLLKLNGVAVCRGPARGTRKIQTVDERDLSGFLREGENCLEVIVHHAGEENFTVNSVYPALIAELPGVFATGKDWGCFSMPSHGGNDLHFSVQTGFAEWIDFRKIGKGKKLRTAEVKSQQLLQKRLLLSGNPPPTNIVHPLCGVEKIYSVAPLYGLRTPAEKAVQLLNDEANMPWESSRAVDFDALLRGDGVTTILPGRDGCGVKMIFSFGGEILGHFSAEVEAPAGTIAELTYGEALQQGRLKSAYLQHKSYHMTDRYVLNDGTNRIGSEIFERGFRMVQLTLRNFSAPVKLSRVFATESRYPFARRGRFVCDDAEVNAVYDASVRTLELCASDVFIDCPWRERGFWVNDLVVENLTSLAAFGASNIHRFAFELAFSQADGDGLIPAICPKPEIEGELDFVFFATNLFMNLMLQEYLLYSGDRDTVARHLPTLRRILDAVWKLCRGGDGVLSSPDRQWNFYDWGFEENGYSFTGCRESMLNYLFVIGTDAFLNMAEMLHFPVDAAELSHRRDSVARAAGKNFLSPTGLLSDEAVLAGRKTHLSSQLAHAFALLSGKPKGAEKERFAAALLDKKLLMPEFYLHIFYFKAAKMLGGKHMYECVRRIRKYWFKVLMDGGGVIPEAGVHKSGVAAMDGDGASLCHGFASAPVWFCQAAILGVTPQTPGLERFDFAPALPGKLRYAAGTVPSPAGEIKVELRKTPRGIDAKLEIPAGLAAELPDGKILSSGTHDLSIR